MTLIYHNSRQHEIKRAIFYGCSNTAGTELPDADILGMTLEQVNEVKKNYVNKTTQWYTKLFSELPVNTANKSKEYNRLCNRYSYARYLSDYLNVEYINFAEPGSSHKKILFNILDHITTDFYQEGDVVFVAATSPLRDYIIDDNGHGLNFIMSHKETLLQLSPLYESLIQLNNDYYLALNNMIILKAIHDSLAVKNIQCIFIETHSYSEHANGAFLNLPTKTDITKRLMQTYRKILKEIRFAPGNLYLYQGTFCGFGHAGPGMHKMFAMDLYKYLIEPK